MSRFGAIAIYIFICTFLSSGSLSAGVSTKSKGDSVAPKAAFLQRNHDFGEVYEGAEIKHDFVVENQGDAPLVIKNIRPD